MGHEGLLCRGPGWQHHQLRRPPGRKLIKRVACRSRQAEHQDHPSRKPKCLTLNHRNGICLLPPLKPAVCDYGYFINEHAYRASREKLIELVQRGTEVDFVWTPEAPEPVAPERVPFLLDAFRSRSRRQARHLNRRWTDSLRYSAGCCH